MLNPIEGRGSLSPLEKTFLNIISLKGWRQGFGAECGREIVGNISRNRSRRGSVGNREFLGVLSLFCPKYDVWSRKI